MKIIDTSAKITSIHFTPMTPNQTFIGFVSFRYSNFLFKSVAVHQSDTKDKIWLTYPEDVRFNRTLAHPADKETYELIEDAVREYLKEHWDGKKVSGQVPRGGRKGSNHAKRTISTESEGSKRTEAATGA